MSVEGNVTQVTPPAVNTTTVAPAVPRKAKSFERLPGEVDAISIKFISVSDCPCLINPIDEAPVAISFFLTTFRVVVLPEPKYVPEIILPLTMIESSSWGKEGNFYTLELTSKHLWSFRLGFRTEREASSAKMALDSLKATALSQLPAWELGAASLKDSDDAQTGANYGWNLYDEAEELERQLTKEPWSERHAATETEHVGVGKDLRPWYRLSDLGCPDNSFGKSPTYPFRIPCPTSCSDDFLTDVLAARSRGRIPVLSFVHLGTGACLARSSQPLIGKGKNRAEDAQLCHYLVNSYTPLSAAPRDQVAASAPGLAQTPTRNHADPSFTSEPSSPTPGGSDSTGRKASVPPSAGWMPPPSLADDDDADPHSPTVKKSAPPLGDAFSGTATASSPVFSQQSPPPRQQQQNSGPSKVLTGKKILYIHDLRPYAAATANLATGGGYETGNSYEHCKVTFAGIDNIHGVSASYKKLKELVVSHSGKNFKSDFWKDWQDTKWMDHIQRILNASNFLVELLEKGESVLTHCTDGWDRTSQCSSIAMMQLDPHFRTIHGFMILIEKEWCSFGHKFAERCNHMLPGTTYCVADNVVVSEIDPNPKVQISPIFLQWLDSVFQIVRQFPAHFEFTPKLLEFLGHQLYSCFYGTFLTNTAKERWFEGLRLKTVSLWTEVERQVELERTGVNPLSFLNQGYDAVSAARFIKKQSNCGIQKITPSTSSKRLVFWEDLYLKHDPDGFRLGLPRPMCSQAPATSAGANSSMVLAKDGLESTVSSIVPQSVASASNDEEEAAASGRRGDGPEGDETEGDTKQPLSPKASTLTNMSFSPPPPVPPRVPRFEVPEWVRINPVTELHDALVEKAKKRRVAEVEFTRELLTRLHVPNRPPPAANTMTQEDGTVVERAKPKEKGAKECRRCREKFGWFNTGQHCADCGQTFCSKCLMSQPPTYKKLCESCQLMSAPPE